MWSKKIQGTSMYPTLFNGDKVYIGPPSKRAEEYSQNDILCVMQSGRLVMHRFVRMQNDEVITKGDNLGFEDQPGIVVGELRRRQLTLISILSRARYFLLRLLGRKQK